MQLSAGSQALGGNADKRLPVLARQEENNGLGGVSSMFQSLAQNVQQTFSQLGMNLSEPRGGGAAADIKHALHDFMHALFHALKELDAGGTGGKSGVSGEGGSAFTASYTSISFSLEVVTGSLESGGSGGGDVADALAAAAGADDADAVSMEQGGSAVSRLQDTYHSLVDKLDTTPVPQASLKDFLKALQKNTDSSAAQQQFSFSLSMTVGSLVYTQA